MLSAPAVKSVGTFAILAAVGPIAFSFDGWIVSTSIAHEIKDARRNLPIALTVGAGFVLLVYALYFVGMCALVGPDTILALGDAHIYVAAEQFLGSAGAKLVLIFVVISVVGTVNGLVLGSIRLPYSLALHGYYPGSRRIARLNPRLGLSPWSAGAAWLTAAVWMAAHYLTQRFHLLPNSDISEISIVMSYLLYLLLYVRVFSLYRRGEIRGAVRGVLCPLLAAMGSLFILTGGMQNPFFPWYAAFCCLVMAAGGLYHHRHT